MSIYNKVLRPALFRLPAETAHEFALKSLKIGLGSEAARKRLEREFVREPFGALERFGLSFKNPLGVAAGLDKNAVVTRELAALGFGSVETGTVTFHPQPGNPRPRLFRLPIDKALINRAGFNNDGTKAVVERLRKNRPNCVLGVNIGKSKIVPVEEATADYLNSFELAATVADYIAVNVSSPNTPNLRELQRADALDELLGALQRRNSEISNQKQRKPLPLLVKIAPDLTQAEIEAIVDVAVQHNFAGIIATNTTIGREGLQTSSNKIVGIGAGGLSGAPLRARATTVIATIFRLARGRLTVIGVGGIFTAEDALEKVLAGASLLQTYTGFVYQGFTMARDINTGLAELLDKQGFKNFDTAVGSETVN